MVALAGEVEPQGEEIAGGPSLLLPGPGEVAQAQLPLALVLVLHPGPPGVVGVEGDGPEGGPLAVALGLLGVHLEGASVGEAPEGEGAHRHLAPGASVVDLGVVLGAEAEGGGEVEVGLGVVAVVEGEMDGPLAPLGPEGARRGLARGPMVVDLGQGVAGGGVPGAAVDRDPVGALPLRIEGDDDAGALAVLLRLLDAGVARAAAGAPPSLQPDPGGVRGDPLHREPLLVLDQAAGEGDRAPRLQGVDHQLLPRAPRAQQERPLQVVAGPLPAFPFQVEPALRD